MLLLLFDRVAPQVRPSRRDLLALSGYARVFVLQVHLTVRLALLEAGHRVQPAWRGRIELDVLLLFLSATRGRRR